MIFVEEDARGVGWTHLEPGSVPKDRGEVLFHFLAVLDFSGCRNQYVSSFFQNGDGLRIQCVGSIYIPLSQFYLCRIYPEVPVVDSVAAFNTNLHIQFLRCSDAVQFHIYTSQLAKISDRYVLSTYCSVSVYFAIFIFDAVHGFGSLQGGCPEVRHFDIGMESLIVGIHEFGNACQWDGRTAEASELICVDIAFFFKEDIQKTYQCSSLTGIVIQCQQLESCIIGCTQCLFNLVFVADCLKFARSHHEVVSHAAHVIVIQDIPEDFKVLGLVYSGIFAYLAEIRECAPLSGLMRYIRLLHGIDFGTVVGHAFRLRAGPAETACSGFHMILIVRLPLPAASHRGSCIYVAGIGCFPVIDEFAYPGYPTTGRFVATRQHAIRGVISVFLSQSDRFVHQILVDRLSVAQSRTMIGPAGTFGLQVETDQIGSNESCFRRTERVEAHVVQSVAAADAENPFP